MAVTREAVVDTSVYIAREHRRPVDLSDPPTGVAVSVITLGELWAGLFSAGDDRSRAIRRETIELALAGPTLPVDRLVARTWATLRAEMGAEKRRIGVNDTWIAATALAHGLPVVTEDSDFLKVPGLDVIRV